MLFCHEVLLMDHVKSMVKASLSLHFITEGFFRSEALLFANHTVESFVELQRDPRRPSTSSSRVFFEDSGTTPPYGKITPSTLHLQLDKCAKVNKCCYILCLWSPLVAKGIFNEVFASFLMVGHTHDNMMLHLDFGV